LLKECPVTAAVAEEDAEGVGGFHTLILDGGAPAAPLRLHDDDVEMFPDDPSPRRGGGRIIIDNESLPPPSSLPLLPL
jgi:hypothetical protein